MKMDINVNISIENLWGTQNFTKNNWGTINFLVGPNGTGKSQFLKKLIPEIERKSGLKVRYLHSDRMIGWASSEDPSLSSSSIGNAVNLSDVESYKTNSAKQGHAGDYLTLLKDNMDVKIRVESILSNLLDRTITLDIKDGQVTPLIEQGTASYNFKEKESHGLKQIISLLTFLYDESYNCILLDEPELHLHPQFQHYFMKLVKEIEGDPTQDLSKKCFFFATHSPNFLDIRTIDDLQNVLVFRPGKLPSYIHNIESKHEKKIAQLLPRLNTHHKQFFFSPHPIFVEGPFDQQIFTFIQERRGKILDYFGSSIIDVQGKGEQDVFYNLCKKLDINCRIISDLDLIFESSLKDSILNADACKAYFTEKGIDYNNLWGELITKIDECVVELQQKYSSGGDTELDKIIAVISDSEAIDNKKRETFLRACSIIRDKIDNIIPDKKSDVDSILSNINHIFEAFKREYVYVLKIGELENYYPPTTIANYYKISSKTKSNSFNIERNFILDKNNSKSDIENRYTELYKILDDATRYSSVSFKPGIEKYVNRFIASILLAFREKTISDIESIRQNNQINYASYEKIIEIQDFSKNDNSFHCKIKINGFDLDNDTIDFDQNFRIANWKL